MGRLTTEQIADMKEYFSRSKEVKTSSLVMKLSHDGLKLIDTIEAQRQDIESLQRELNAEISVNEALTADKDEQAGRTMQQEMRIEYLIEHCEELEYLLRRTLPILEVASDQQELIEQINELLGGKEDAGTFCLKKKARSNTMPKAVLELPEMPESCWQCPCAQYYDTYGECGAIEYDIDGDFRPVLPSEGRRSDCPLKLVEEVEDAS